MTVLLDLVLPNGLPATMVSGRLPLLATSPRQSIARKWTLKTGSAAC
jgi:hypothetical protein